MSSLILRLVYPDLGPGLFTSTPLFSTPISFGTLTSTPGRREIKQLKEFIKDTINNFFKANNKRFEKFITELEKDAAYPDSFNSPIAGSREFSFSKIAYIVEMNTNSWIRKMKK